MKLSREINVRFILMVIMLLGFWLKSSAELPFKNAQEFTDYVRNLELDKLEPIKSVEELLDPVGKEPTDPVLVKGIKLFNDGKIEKSIKYFQEIVRKTDKYTESQREYALYQLFHIEKFSMVDPRYNGRPTNIDRTDSNIYGESLLIAPFKYPFLPVLMLNIIYPAPFTDYALWRDLSNDYQTLTRQKGLDMELLHSLLKAYYQRNGGLKYFPKVECVYKMEPFGLYDYIEKEFVKKSGPFKTLEDYLDCNPDWSWPTSPKVKKALKAGSTKKQYQLFEKIEGYYGKYQCWRILTYKFPDYRYRERPTTSFLFFRPKQNFTEVPKNYGKKWKYIRIAPTDYLSISALEDSTIRVIDECNLEFSMSNLNGAYLNKEYVDFIDMLINRTFPVGGDASDIVSSILFDLKQNENKIGRHLEKFEQYTKVVPLLHRMKIDSQNSFGIGLSADEMYTEAMKILPRLPELKLDKRYKWKDRDKLSKKGMTYLLRSAFWGNEKALNAFIVFATMYINSKPSYVSDTDPTLLEEISKKQNDLVKTLNQLSSLNKPEHKPTLYAYKKLFDESYAYHHANYQKEMNRLEKLEQQRREEKARMWLGIANTLIQGAQQIANIYAQSSTMKQQAKQTKQTKQKGGSDTSLASYLEDYLEDPNHFDRDFRMLMQAADQMVRQKDWNDYCTMRAMMQQMGMDLSYEEYKMNQAKALMDLKEQGIDLVAEQRARNQEMHDFYRSQMNSGKENVERIKEQNRMKYGGGSSSTTSSSTSTTSSRSSATNSPRPSAPKTPSQTSTTPKQQNPQANNDAHQQYMSGNLNVQESSYGEKIKNVSLWIKDGANYRSASLSGELYRKEGQLFVKIGGTFFRVGSIGGAYNSYIMYGMKAYYFNR